MKKRKSKFYWDGKPIENYTKEQVIDILYEILKVVKYSISDEARTYIDRLIQKDIDEQQKLL